MVAQGFKVVLRRRGPSPPANSMNQGLRDKTRATLPAGLIFGDSRWICIVGVSVWLGLGRVGLKHLPAREFDEPGVAW